MGRADFQSATQCYRQAGDRGGQFLLATSRGDEKGVKQLADDAAAKGATNVSFLASFISNQHEKCLDLLISCGRLSEAAMFARTYFPSKTSSIVDLWKASLVEQEHKKIADSIADPEKYDNLFEDYRSSLKAEQFVKAELGDDLPSASTYPEAKNRSERDIYEVIEKQAEQAMVDDEVESEQAEGEEATEQVEETTEQVEESPKSDTAEEDTNSPLEIITAEDVAEAEPKQGDESLDLEAEMEALGVNDAEDIDTADIDIDDADL